MFNSDLQQSIYFPEVSLKKITKLFDALAVALRRGVFILPGFYLRYERCHTTEAKYLRVTLSFQPTAVCIRLILSNPELNTLYHLYRLHENRQSTFLFALNEGKVIGFITNCSPSFFRQLLFLSDESQCLVGPLAKTDYWLFGYELPSYREFYRSLRHIIEKKRVTPALIRYTSTNLSRMAKGHPNAQHEFDIGKMQADRDAAFNRLCQLNQYPFDGTFADFIQPGSAESRYHVCRELQRQLKSLMVFPKEFKQDARPLALFIGMGRGDNVALIQKAYPALVCFGMEPWPSFIAEAQSRHNLPRAQLFNTTLEAFQCESRVFDYIFIFNVNFSEGHLQQFAKCARLLRKDGRLVVGRAVTDSQYVCSPFTVKQLLGRYFRPDTIIETEGAPEKIEYKQQLTMACGQNLLPEEKAFPDEMTMLMREFSGRTSQALQDGPDASSYQLLQKLSGGVDSKPTPEEEERSYSDNALLVRDGLIVDETTCPSCCML